MEGTGSPFVSPTGYIELDSDCQYSIETKSTRSRESVNPKEDLAFYFDTYLSPKYGLGNINVNNVASFMKELEMNWSKLTPGLKDNVMDIMVDGILTKDSDFKSRLLSKLQIQQPVVNKFQVKSKSTFGKKANELNLVQIATAMIALALVIFLISKMNKTPGVFSKMM